MRIQVGSAALQSGLDYEDDENVVMTTSIQVTPAPVTLPLGHWVPSISPSKFKVPVPSAGTSSVTDYPLTVAPSFSTIIPTSPLPGGFPS
ncbi:unnamed protein product [Penicillium pancosmium]